MPHLIEESLTEESLARLRAIRRDLHAHPELPCEEKRTSALVAEYLRQCGVDEVHENIGRHGVVAVINGREPGRSIALRADMDALPMQEIAPDGEDRPHISVNAGCFHGCGHDGHTVMLLGAAKALAARRDFAGRALLLFQPAEEALAGALAMIKDGLFERFPFEEIYGLHNVSELELGQVSINEGAALSGSDNFTIRIQGKASHGAAPHLSIDPIVIAARLVMDFQTIVSRNVPPLRSAALSFGEINGGASNNIIPDSLRLRGTLRTYDEDTRALAKARIQALVDSASSGFGCTATLEYTHSCPPLINDARLANELVQAVRAARGADADQVRLSQIPQTPSEDFAFYLQRVKGVFTFIGQGRKLLHHHPHFDFNDDLIPYGVDFWRTVVRSRLPLGQA